MALFRSQYAIAEAPPGELGAYGAVLLKPWTPRAGGWRENELQVPGTVVPAEIVAKWPVANRLALRENKYVRYFVSPDEAAEAAVSIAQAVRAHPERAQLQNEADIRRRRVEALAKARQAKADKRAGAVL